MAYRLVLTDPPKNAAAAGSEPRDRGLGAAKDVGENVFLNDLPSDYKVFLFYYPAEMPNPPLENALRQLGQGTGKNLFVNIGMLNDPNYAKIVQRFSIQAHPVIVMTAVSDLASPSNDYATTYARLDSKFLLDSPERTVQCVQKLFDLFLQGKVADAIAKAKWTERKQLAAAVARVLAEPLKVIGNFIASRDISVSVIEGKFELKR